MQSGAAALSDRRSGQRSLFGDIEESEPAAESASLPDIPELEQRELLAAEKEVLGFYLTSHPLEQYAEKLKKYSQHSTSRIAHSMFSISRSASGSPTPAALPTPRATAAST